ncbi:protein-glutamate methylesterase/protein-glutamine glutaminase [Oceanobacillus salinisoli]|uniref:protein-glutamate methylesterase/protein-glutamine glutaminase n=1 Tax=Oceanobacillus salinisoli TaxID=2678611 RepID=UPI0012E113B8|nr:chemotaxis response regulator protein-glutamate methylesterase [Oceanobacillus salinisoli]
MERIRVIVIDDSAFMRKVISDILGSDERINVISTARNGLEGLKKIQQSLPDVVTMDVHMPIMDGIKALENLMQLNPLPVVMLSGDTKEGESKALEAIRKGAVDFITKPSGPISLDIESIREEIIKKVINASSINMNHKNNINNIYPQSAILPHHKLYHQTVIAIGTSTGGPKAIERVIHDLPSNFAPPIFIVQHMPAGFTKSLADRLNMLNTIHVKEAENGEKVDQHTAYIAPGNQHMRVKEEGPSLIIELSKDMPRNNHRPSVDVLFESLAEITPLNKIAVILTGMGSDGTNGLKRLKEENKYSAVIAESEETAIVYGMPRAAVNAKTVDFILPINQVAEKIAGLQEKLAKK